MLMRIGLRVRGRACEYFLPILWPLCRRPCLGAAYDPCAGSFLT